MWLGLLAVPWRPWSTRERLEAQTAQAVTDVSQVTVLIPARDEAECIAATLTSLAQQGGVGDIILIDDQSSDGTASIARDLNLERLQIIPGTTPPPGWSGKLWALAQGLKHASTPLVLLLDADIELRPGVLAALLQMQRERQLGLVSVMARLHVASLWEKLLLPPFIYFFKLIYPFALANKRESGVAAAAGGCILLEKARLESIGGFEALHDAIIDDCTLARLVKRDGATIWLGLSHDVRAIRPYGGLPGIWNMVARTAFTQLHYSLALLLLCTLLLGVSFVVPLAGLLSDAASTNAISLLALFAMALTFLPTVRYYDLSFLWVLTLPVAACLFLAMTWTSAIRYWFGERSRWKDRSYERNAAS
jgi:hopene-associated glycosyltransferase HpnB